MTLSQALRKIAKLKGELNTHLARAAQGTTYITKEAPAFGFHQSLEKANLVRDELIATETALRIANANTKVQWGARAVTLTEATCLLREYKAHISWLNALPVKAREKSELEGMEWDQVAEKHIRTKREVTCELPEAKRAEWVEREQKNFDALNDLVEATNHKTMLK